MGLTHNENKKALENALGLKFFTGRNADWGAADIMKIKGNEFNGMFIIDMYDLTMEEKLILMVRVHDPIKQEEEDTDILEFNSETDDINLLIQKLDWI
jgi:hypothetical protein